MSSGTAISTTSFTTMPTTDNYVLDYTEIDQGLNLWSEILPIIEKQIVTLTNVAQEMQECPERQKYVDALTKIAVRVNDVEDKATTCIKEARTQLKKIKLVDKTNDTQDKVSHPKVRKDRDNDEDSDEDEENDNEMEIDESQIDEQIEVSALNTENLEKLENRLNKILIKPPDSNESNLEADNRYAEFLEYISKMQDVDDDENEANIVEQVASNKCPLTQKTFVEPVQNKKCKHKYEKKAVLKYIADKNKTNRSAKCPLAGCNTILNEKDLVNA
ncbi:unnamed protein product [Rotaria socialis]|uniref:E3 SUMO-protein ligase NSE2 n=1 Tax=Rotaria socialis TaxID=392032 RepID=A0A817NSS2_9BILA|nr:unnamed protein product [Rotaria socialis]CAF3766077.1 unnamed protein product [Rotaria socialis]CAF4346955.1 unnamed protein product [Rotaria socialis]CAF4406498.1 unnamed protein product [Rotaria socialis]